jgi:uncharacterized protein YodC (DUF2158 family)
MDSPYRPGDRVIVRLPSGEAPGVISLAERRGVYLVRVDHHYFASLVVTDERLRPATDPPLVIPAAGKYATGDRVRCPYGGPVMTVEVDYGPGLEYRYRCAWADPDGSPRAEVFRAEQLVPAG